MNDEEILRKFDEWLTEESPAAALTMRQWLEPVEGKNAVIFPPTYATPEGWKESWIGYNIDRFEDGSSVCQIDSVGSQANRLEPIFKQMPYRRLVPQVVIKAGDKEVDLLEVGHRAGDAIVRFSSLAEDLESAFKKIKNEANAEPLGRISPTSLVFGVWDSRGTQTKLPRIVRSVIRAFNVKAMHRSAQYIPAIEYEDEGLLPSPESKKDEGTMSELGFRHAPAPWTHGGIQAEEIRRDATLNLVALRALGADPEDMQLKLRRYILGLSLVCFTAPQETFLREGCQLVPDAGRRSEYNLVLHTGERRTISFSHDEALKYAQVAADDFGVGERREGTFDAKEAKDKIKMSKEDRKKARRSKGNNP